MEVRRDTSTNPAVVPLLAAHLAEQRGAVPAGFSFALDGAALSGSGITFFTAWHGDMLAGMGAVKSMRTTPEARGHGAGYAILSTIIAEARVQGMTHLLLETGTTAAYDAAIRLYTRAGFVPCDAFADYRASPHNRFFRLTL